MLRTHPATSVSVVPCPPSLIPPPRPDLRYTLDGQEVTLRDLLAVNDFDNAEVVRIRNLPPGESLNLGGGAAPVFVLTRLPSEEVAS